MPRLSAAEHGMLPFDDRTLFFAFVVVFASLCIAVLVVWRQTPSQPGLGRLASAFWLMALGVGMVAGFGIGNGFGVVAGNSIVVLGAAQLFQATREFYRRQRQWWPTLLGVAVGAAASAYFFAVDRNVDARIVIVSLVTASYAGGSCWVSAVEGSRAKEGLSTWLIASAHGIATCVLLARAVLTATGVQAGAALGSHWPTAMAVLGMIFAGLGTTVGFIAAANRRLMLAATEAAKLMNASEERYRSLVETSPDVIYRTDHRGRFSYCNPASERLLGYDRDELLGRHFLELIRPDFRPAAEVFYRRQNAEEVASTYFEFPAIAKDGRELWIGQHVQRLSGPGEKVGFEAVARDISELKRAEAELQAEKRLLEQLVTVARMTAEGSDLDATLQTTLNVVISLTGASSGSLILLDERGEVTRGIFMGPDGPVAVERAQCQQVMETGLAGWVARHGESVIVDDASADPRWLPSPALPVRSALAVRIASGSSLVGVLTLVHPEPGRFVDENLRLLVEAAAQIALSLRNAQVSAARLRLANEESLLFETLDAATRHLDRDEMARAAADAIARRTGWHVSVAEPGKDGHWRMLGGPAGVEDGQQPLDAGIIGRAFRQGTPQVVADVQADRDYVPIDAPVRRELAVPMRYRDRVLGVLNLESEAAGELDPDLVRLAESLAGAMALGLQNADLYETLTEQHARLEAMVRSNRDGLVLADAAGRLLMVSAPALALLGLAGEPADWAGRDGIDLVATLGAESAALHDALLQPELGDEVREGEHVIGSRMVHWLSLPVQTLGRLLVLRDVTREREVERMREDLTRTMVHDLRTPLTSILAAVELAHTAPGATPEQKTLLDVAERNAHRQLRLIDAILDIDRLEQGGFPVERRDVAFADLAAEALRLALPRASTAGIELVSAVPWSLPPVHVDRGLVGRVLENLIGNALKFTPAGGTVRVEASSPQPGSVWVTVRDTGPGVPSELRGRLFTKFAAGEQEGRGSGLGLAFCRLVLEAHGGRIWLDADHGPGASFTFTLSTAGEARQQQAVEPEIALDAER